MLATVLCALIVFADRLMDAWSNSSLMVALLVLWVVVFAGLMLFGKATGNLAVRLAAIATGWYAPTEIGVAEIPAPVVGRSGADTAPTAPPDAVIAGVTPRRTEPVGKPVFYRPW